MSIETCYSVHSERRAETFTTPPESHAADPPPHIAHSRTRNAQSPLHYAHSHPGNAQSPLHDAHSHPAHAHLYSTTKLSRQQPKPIPGRLPGTGDAIPGPRDVTGGDVIAPCLWDGAHS